MKWVLIFFFYLAQQIRAEDSIQCNGKFNHKNEKHGVWVCKNNQTLVKKERYKNGKLVTYILFNEKGEIIETRNKKGKIKKFNPCGC